MRYNKKNVAGCFDYTLILPTTTNNDIFNLCAQALEYDVAAVCVSGAFVEYAKEKLKGSKVKVCCVVGYPLGGMDILAKVAETQIAISKGADEIDVVLNIGMLRDNNFEYIYNEIKSVVDAAGSVPVKVTIETYYLNDTLKIKVCELAIKAGVAYVKTSTEGCEGGATVSDVALLRTVANNKVGIIASTNVNTLNDFIAMVSSGANRVAGTRFMDIIGEFGDAY